MAEEKDIKYLNKDFSTFKSDLIEYAKSYYPTVYNDFSQASPGSMFIEMAAYVGDVLSFYLDNQLQETFLQYAKQPNNLYTMAYMLGYRPKVTSAAIVDLDVYQTVPATIDPISFEYIPDFQYALIVEPGMQIKSNVNNSSFFDIPNKIDFTTSSSYDPTTINILTTAGGNPNSYLFTKKARAISGEVKTATFSFGAAQRFPSITIQDSNIINILDVTDSDGNKWYEVPYLAQDTIIDAIQNTDPNTNNQVPYLLDRIKVPRRFTSRFLSNESLVLEFGPGINTVANQFIPDESILPNPSSISMGMTVGGDSFTASFDPTNFVTTQTYGLAPRNTTLTIQ